MSGGGAEDDRRRHRPGAMRLTLEEQAVLHECRSEARLYRGVPVAVGVAALCKYLQAYQNRFRSHFLLKASLLTVGSYMLGTASYFNICRRRVIERVPDGALAQAMKTGVWARHGDDAERRADEPPCGAGAPKPPDDAARPLSYGELRAAHRRQTSPQQHAADAPATPLPELHPNQPPDSSAPNQSKTRTNKYGDVLDEKD